MSGDLCLLLWYPVTSTQYTTSYAQSGGPKRTAFVLSYSNSPEGFSLFPHIWIISATCRCPLALLILLKIKQDSTSVLHDHDPGRWVDDLTLSILSTAMDSVPYILHSSDDQLTSSRALHAIQLCYQQFINIMDASKQ